MKEASKEGSKQRRKQATKEASNEGSKQRRKQATKEASNEGSKEAREQGREEGSKQARNQARKQLNTKSEQKKERKKTPKGPKKNRARPTSDASPNKPVEFSYTAAPHSATGRFEKAFSRSASIHHFESQSTIFQIAKTTQLCSPVLYIPKTIQNHTARRLNLPYLNPKNEKH